MSGQAEDWIKLVAQIISTLLAILALVIGLRNESRNQRRFQTQLSQSRRFAHANSRPMLQIVRKGYEDEKAIVIANLGPGTAVLYDIAFTRENRRSTDIAELIDVDNKLDISWNNSTSYEVPYYLAGKTSEDAFRINADRLESCEVPTDQIPSLLESIEEQLDAIEITIKYKDVFNNRFQCVG